MRIGGQQYAVRPGDLTLTPPGSEERFDLTGDGFHWYVRLKPDPSWMSGTMLVDIHHSLGDRAIEARHQIELIIRDMQQAGGDASHPSAWAAAARSQALLCWLGASRAPAAQLSHAEACLEKAATLLRSLECARLSVAEIARRAGLSQNRLARAFATRHGQTMVQYRNHHLVENAKWLMESTSLTLEAIRGRIQVPDAQRFNKLFRKATGMSPRDWIAAHPPVTNSEPLPRVQ